MAGSEIHNNLANAEPDAFAAACDELLTIHVAACERGRISSRARLAQLLFQDIKRNGDATARQRANAVIARALSRVVKHTHIAKEGDHA